MTPRACPNDRGAGLFTYALARETALPLFFQGTDFTNTAIDSKRVVNTPCPTGALMAQDRV